MARVSITEVRAILTPSESTALIDNQITAAICAANIMVDGMALFPCHTDKSLKATELYLSADTAVVTTGGGSVKAEKIGDASVTYGGIGDDGHSHYFKTATMLDCSGTLMNLGKLIPEMVSIGCA
jgi:hypothetical protein